MAASAQQSRPVENGSTPSLARRAAASKGWLLGCFSLLCGAALAISLAGCRGPAGATQTSPGFVYRQAQANAIRDDSPSDRTQSVLLRFGQSDLFAKDPDAVLAHLHEMALNSGDRQLLFALSELSYLAGSQLRRSVKPWESRDARDYYLGSAVYAWFFLFGEPESARPSPFDRQFRLACDLYNRGLGWALAPKGRTNAEVEFAEGPRRLPVGGIELNFNHQQFPWPMEEFSRFVRADAFLVRGLSTRNRQPGLGSPLIAATRLAEKTLFFRSIPSTVILKVHGSFQDLQHNGCSGTLELYSTYEDATVVINGQKVPLETDTTAPIAYSLNQAPLWTVGRHQFLSPVERIPSGVYQTRPYEPGKIPVVCVHGTFSSPVWWAEMVNTLAADPVVRKRCQIWWFIYNTGSPMVYSAARLRQALADKVKELDPNGQDPALREMVVVGHSQGGLLTKLTATDTSDTLWQAFLPKERDRVRLSQEQEQLVRQYLVFKPLPFVKRVVFICTPHRGSYQAGDFVRRLAARLVALPEALVKHERTLLDALPKNPGSPNVARSARTSLDSMAPDNPLLLALADLPLGPGITGNSIIAVRGNGDPVKGDDGLVRYSSAHLENMESECIVRGGHSCLRLPATIEEVRRILRAHAAAFSPSASPSETDGEPPPGARPSTQE